MILNKMTVFVKKIKAFCKGCSGGTRKTQGRTCRQCNGRGWVLKNPSSN